MKVSNLYSKTKLAVMKHNMISSGDKVAVGISGGKDSLVLLYALHGLSKQKNYSFEIHPIMVHMGFDNFNIDKTKEFISSLGLELNVIDTNLGKLIFEDRKEKNPCSLCSKMRRGILNKFLKELGCNKLALGHHQDDIVTTAMMSLLYEGRYHSISPTAYMSKADVTLIRPLLYVKEREIISLVSDLNIPVADSPCPVDKITKRRQLEGILLNLEKEIPNARDKIFTALKSTDFLNLTI